MIKPRTHYLPQRRKFCAEMAEELKEEKKWPRVNVERAFRF